MALTPEEELELLQLEEEEYQSSLKAKEVPQPSAIESAFGGVQQGVTLGWAPAIAGLGAAAGTATEVGFDPTALKQAYEEGKKEEISKQAALEQANPMSYLGGSVAGGVAIPGSSLKALTAQGVISGAGGADSLTQGAVSGGLLGYAGGKIGKGAEKIIGKGLDAAGPTWDRLVQTVGIDKATEWLKKKAGTFAEKAAGLERTQGQRETLAKMIGKGKFEEGEIGQKLLEEGIVTTGTSSKTIAERASKAKTQAGQEIGKIIEQSPDINAESLREAIMARANQLPDVGTNKALKRQLENIAETYETPVGSEMLPSSLVKEEKSKYGEMADWMKPKTDVNVTAYEELDKALKAGMSPEDLAKYTEANRAYEILTPAEKAAGKQSAADIGKKVLSVGALPAMAAGAGYMQEGPTTGMVAGALAFRLAQKRGASTMAGALWKPAEIIERAPEKFKGVLQSALQQGEEAFAKTQFLLQSSNPEYRQHMQEAKDKEVPETSYIPIEGAPLESATPGPGVPKAILSIAAKLSPEAYKKFIIDSYVRGVSELGGEAGNALLGNLGRNAGPWLKAEYMRLIK